MTAVPVAAPAGPEDDGDEVVLDRELCRRGRLAAVVLHHEDGDVWAGVRCGCGAFEPAAPDVSASAAVRSGRSRTMRGHPTEGGRS